MVLRLQCPYIEGAVAGAGWVVAAAAGAVDGGRRKVSTRRAGTSSQYVAAGLIESVGRGESEGEGDSAGGSEDGSEGASHVVCAGSRRGAGVNSDAAGSRRPRNVARGSGT